jgi:hypothetical protein
VDKITPIKKSKVLIFDVSSGRAVLMEGSEL